ncbi:MAG: SMC-Scp complex subunit ScpB [Oscillospiraceae bacterium]|nr:SMC-Scp complex subunit ScpB [Oscillospiraceae bacterium]
MKIKQVSIIEAILFASGEPVESERLAQASGIETSALKNIIELLRDRYEQTDSALTVLKLGGAYQLSVGGEYIDYIKAAMETRKAVPLSNAAFEVLTIIAYNQPVTKGFIEHVRGVDSGSVVNSLVEKNLLEEAGRLDVPGRPITYKTTPAFLRCFQLSSLDDLPAPPGKDGQVSFDELSNSDDKEG